MNAARSMRALTFKLDDEILAIEADHVREILDLVPITSVPNASPFAAGLVNVRGRVVPLADLRVALGMRKAADTDETRIVVVEADIDGESTIVGLLADKVYDVTDIESAAIEEVPKVGVRWRPGYVSGIGKRNGQFIVIPNLHQILATEGRTSNRAPTSRFEQ